MSTHSSSVSASLLLLLVCIIAIAFILVACITSTINGTNVKPVKTEKWPVTTVDK